METYIVTVKVVLEIDAVDQNTAIELAEDAVKRTRFGTSHKMVSVRVYGQSGHGGQEKRDEHAQ